VGRTKKGEVFKPGEVRHGVLSRLWRFRQGVSPVPKKWIFAASVEGSDSLGKRDAMALRKTGCPLRCRNDRAIRMKEPPMMKPTRPYRWDRCYKEGVSVKGPTWKKTWNVVLRCGKQEGLQGVALTIGRKTVHLFYLCSECKDVDIENLLRTIRSYYKKRGIDSPGRESSHV